MRRILVVLVASLCVVSITAVVASASGKAGLTLKTAKGPLVKGQEVTGFSSNLIFTTEKGKLECSENTLIGTVETNGEAKDKGPITGEISEGAETEGKETKLCKTGLGPAKIESKHLPWTIEFTSKGTIEVKGKKVTFKSTFPGLGGISCVFEASTVKATFNTSGPVIAKTTSQKFKANKKESNEACPKEGTLSGEFAMTSDKETIEAEL